MLLKMGILCTSDLMCKPLKGLKNIKATRNGGFFHAISLKSFAPETQNTRIYAHYLRKSFKPTGDY